MQELEFLWEIIPDSRDKGEGKKGKEGGHYRGMKKQGTSGTSWAWCRMPPATLNKETKR